MPDVTEFAVEVEQEADGRWLAEVPGWPGAMAYGTTEDEARENAVALLAGIIAAEV